ncbi:hypothetical protein FRC07_010515, partial [Ceratobasidium sp. 392]
MGKRMSMSHVIVDLLSPYVYHHAFLILQSPPTLLQARHIARNNDVDSVLIMEWVSMSEKTREARTSLREWRILVKPTHDSRTPDTASSPTSRRRPPLTERKPSRHSIRINARDAARADVTPRNEHP